VHVLEAITPARKLERGAKDAVRARAGGDYPSTEVVTGDHVRARAGGDTVRYG
jgi:hypothetical protein